MSDQPLKSASIVLAIPPPKFLLLLIGTYRRIPKGNSLTDGDWLGDFYIGGVPDGGDHRLSYLYQYWLSLHPQQGLPARERFDPVEVPKLLTRIAMQDVVCNPIRFRYRLMGSDVAQLREADNTGKWVHEIYPNFDESPVYKRLTTVIEQRRAVWCIGQPAYHSRNEFRLREVLHLPFASDGETIDIILSAVIVHR